MHTTNGSGQRYTDAQRMELRSHVSLAGEVIAKVWPMTSVIARNPLQGLEHLRFEEAVERGEQLFGGSGTLSQDAFQDAFRRGRIQAQHLEEALRALATDQEVPFGDRQVSHLDVLRAVMVAGGRDDGRGARDAMVARLSAEDPVTVARVTEQVRRMLPGQAGDTAAPGSQDGFAEWPS